MPNAIIHPPEARQMQAVSGMNTVARSVPHYHVGTPSKNMITGILILGSAIITASAATFTDQLYVRWAILTLAGAIMVSAMAWMLNDLQESKRHVFGRAIGAMLGGVIGSRIYWHFSEWARDYLQDPLLMVGAGAFFGFIGYMLAKAIVKGTDRRANRIVDKQFDKWVMPPQETVDPKTIRYAAEKEE